MKKIIGFINTIVAERGKPKIDFQVVGLDMDLFHAIKAEYLDDFKAAMDNHGEEKLGNATAGGRIRKIVEDIVATVGGLDRERIRCRSSWCAAGCWTRASVWTAAASTRSVPWLQRWASCPASMAPVCSPAARPRC